MHPFSLITFETPELFEAARQNLAWRQNNGQGGGGWSCAHAQLMHSRFFVGEKAYQGLNTLLNSGMENNLLNARRVYQIDGNFGATAGIAEMLIQSHIKDKEGNFIIDLLPAIPSAWSTGSVKGLCARGGFVVDMEWDEGKIKSAFISSKKGGTCKVRFQDKIIDLTLNVGEKRKLTEF